jgi:hypothetical protein
MSASIPDRIEIMVRSSRSVCNIEAIVKSFKSALSHDRSQAAKAEFSAPAKLNLGASSWDITQELYSDGSYPSRRDAAHVTSGLVLRLQAPAHGSRPVI